MAADARPAATEAGPRTGTDRPFVASPVPLPDVVRREAGEIEAVQDMLLETDYQAGHYPGRPIYPGVFLVESVVGAARAGLGEPGSPLPLVLTRLDVARFTKPGIPGTTFTARLRLAEAGAHHWDVRAECTNDAGERLCQLSLQVGLPEAVGA